MMDLILLFFTGITIGISGAMIPGPLTLFTVSEALKGNRFAGLKIISGHIAVEFVFICFILLGLQGLVTSSKAILSTVSIIGSLALIIMGVMLLLYSGKMRLPDMKTNSGGFNKGLFIGGIFFSVISPGFLVWWATIGISTIIRALLFLGVLGAIILTLGHWLADIAWYGFMSYAIDKGKRYLDDKSYQNVMRFFSILLIVLGVYFLVR
ncbi:LysE family translocator [Candidatus Omnitrophota bacterium]